MSVYHFGAKRIVLVMLVEEFIFHLCQAFKQTLELPRDNMKQQLRCIHTWHLLLISDMRIQYRKLCLYDETRGEMTEISTHPGSLTKAIHLHHNVWPLLLTFSWKLNRFSLCSYFN